MDNFVNYHLNIFSEIEKISKKLSHDEFVEKIEILSGSSVGQHIRHIIEFYICLFSEKNYVNYDERERNLLIENSSIYTQEILETLKVSLKNLDFDRKVIFKQSLNDQEVFLNTSYARELIYLGEHTIHHFALIKIGITAICPDLTLDQNFGVADSTIKYRATQTPEKCVC
ncbi:hypothetical protein EGI26_02570 [Lacihabitans sp. CCS-44]|uniref:hypothetical protein n=1 Tax=Lacihabitans sp. CCS-44 TaxID=2487331 RepID=UPI0020CBC09D|nr:hypothetical protein [Lacihabitans sp. CCS-44]MCP9754045.1 hypothetical protein [Lacihabitans sp. CCS-44]